MENIVGPLYIIGTGICIFLAVGLIAWIYDKTRRRIVHPSLGELTYAGDKWWGSRPHFRDGLPAVRLELPGGKPGPDSEAVEKFEALWKERDRYLEAAVGHALEDLDNVAADLPPEEQREVLGCEYSEELEITTAHLEKTWVLSEIALRDLQPDDSSTVPKWCWVLEFAVAWDDEHSRTAHFDLEGNLLSYDLSCTVFVPA